MGAYAQEVLNDSPRWYFPQNETAGTAAVDAVGGASGVYTGGFTLNQAGLLLPSTDGAPLFDRGTGYITVADRAELDLADSFTLEGWVYLTAYQDASRNPITFADKGTNAYIVRISNALDGTWILRKNGVSTLVTSTSRIPLNAITYWAVTKNGATVRQVQNDTDVTGTVTNATMADNALALGLGAADVGSGPANGFMAGRQAHQAGYSGALSAARLLQHYQAGAGRPLSMMI